MAFHMKDATIVDPTVDRSSECLRGHTLAIMRITQVCNRTVTRGIDQSVKGKIPVINYFVLASSLAAVAFNSNSVIGTTCSW
jgi:hypothetical protein